MATMTALVIATGSALAADAVYDPPPAAPVIDPPTVSNWDGLYGGIYLGYGIDDTSKLRVTTPAGAPISDRYFTDSDGWLGGAFVGYNYAFGSTILGGEADFEFTGIEDTRAIFGGGTGSMDLAKQASLRLRLGYDMGAFLPYITGGLAIGDVEYFARAADGTSNTDGETEIGYVLGAGVDVAVTERVFARAEYRWTDYGDDTFSSSSGSTNFEFKTRYNSIRVGVGIKF